MKKLIAVIALLVLVSVGAFAQIQMSAGGGLYVDYSAGNGIDEVPLIGEIDFPNLSFGGYAFFDITYAEISVYFGMGQIGMTVLGSTEDFCDITVLGFSILGKYPISMGFITLFPMAGVSYNMILSAEATGGLTISDSEKLNQFGLHLGVGADFNITEKLFIRATGLFTLRIPSTFQDDFAKATGPNSAATMGYGPAFKVGLGYKF